MDDFVRKEVLLNKHMDNHGLGPMDSMVWNKMIKRCSLCSVSINDLSHWNNDKIKIVKISK